MATSTKAARKAEDTARYAAALAIASQLIHLWVLPGEFAARPLTGSFVLLAAVGQGMLAASLLVNPGRWTIRFGLLLNATIVLAWAATRVAGFPALLGFVRLPAEPLGLVATFFEVALVISLLKVSCELKTKRKRRRVR